MQCNCAKGLHYSAFNYTVTKSWRSEQPTMELIYLIKYTKSDGQMKEFRLLQNVQRHWEDIGILVGIHPNTLKSFQLQRGNNLEKQCQDVFQTWLEQGLKKYPVTWNGLLEVLKDVQLNEISRELEKVLGKYMYVVAE